MNYKNFKTAFYCTINDVESIYSQLTPFEDELAFIEKHLSINKVYIETYRGRHWVERDKILRLKELFNQRNIAVSGGITPDISANWEFKPFCYTNQTHLNDLKQIVAFTAELFDEFIFDDFFFTNCRCENCISAKGNRSWQEFRCDMLKQTYQDIIMATAKHVNPNVSVIIKFPNWYEYYQITGYNLGDAAKIFDKLYTGTETRDPKFTQQNLPRYLSYFLPRYLENVKPGHNNGCWFDAFDCMYNLGSYAEQCYLTVFAKAKEVTLFSLGLLLTRHRVFLPVAGFALDTADSFIGALGNPQGIPCYKPYNSNGENYLHGFLGMLGFPLEPQPTFPLGAKLVLLTESAAFDSQIIERIKQHLIDGNDIVITSGLLASLQNKGITDFGTIKFTNLKASTQLFAFPMYECSFGEYHQAVKAITIPQIEFGTNDFTQLAVAISEQKNYPLLIKTEYAKGNLYILTIPDDFGDLYHIPTAVLNEIRRIFAKNLSVRLKGPNNIALFLYDNNTVIVESFLKYNCDIQLVIDHKDAVATDLISCSTLTGNTIEQHTEINLKLAPASFRVFKIM
ncbi:MAG: permease [Deltaproteobacteria bacterium]|nr:permease [Deltaproteobacteria bacterium]